VKFLVLMAEEDHFARWEAIDDVGRKEAFDRFDAFATAVEARGAMLGGDALAAPQEARTLRPGGSRPAVAGPFAETVEQLSGFYLVQSDDLEDLLEICALLAGDDGGIEVRATVDHAGEPS